MLNDYQVFVAPHMEDTRQAPIKTPRKWAHRKMWQKEREFNVRYEERMLYVQFQGNIYVSQNTFDKLQAHLDAYAKTMWLPCAGKARGSLADQDIKMGIKNA